MQSYNNLIELKNGNKYSFSDYNNKTKKITHLVLFSQKVKNKALFT